MPIDAPPSSRPTTDTGFGKVLSSIHGLQQRLDELSVDEISNAHEKAAALVERLHDCQRQVAALARLKEAVSLANVQIRAIPEQDMDLIAADDLDKYSQLRAIVKVGKLIRMRRSLQGVEAAKDSASLDHLPLPAADERDDKIAVDASLPLPPSPPETARPQEKVRRSGSDAPAAREIATPAIEPAGQNREPAANVNEPVFNQRLLNELIETYGEFTVSVPATKPEKSATMIPPEVLESQRGSQLTSLEKTRPEPAFVRSAPGVLGLPPPQQKPSKSTPPRPSPKHKRRVEIDRQLKNIIKDYGEYDLYSPQKSSDLKLVALAALVLLGLLIVGVYLW